jgi:hypothetical protein
MRSKSSSQKGASAVEFALLLPLLMLITFGIIEFGLFMYNQQIITNASREGARAGIVARVPARLPEGPEIPPQEASCVSTNPLDPVSISCVVGNYCRNHLVSFSSTAVSPRVSVGGYAATPMYGTNLIVTVTYDYHFLVLPNFFTSLAPHLTSTTTPGAWPMQAVTVMKYE